MQGYILQSACGTYGVIGCSGIVILSSELRFILGFCMRSVWIFGEYVRDFFEEFFEEKSYLGRIHVVSWIDLIYDIFAEISA